MYNEKTNKIKWIAVFTAIVLLFAGVISSLVIAIGNKPVEAKPDSPTEDLSAATNDNPMVLLSMGEAVVMAAPEIGKTDNTTESTAYVSQSVTATITPTTVVDKYVTWSIAWASDAPLKNSNISDYIKITDESQGNLTATVNCYKAFKGSKAVLTCTTRQGNKTATIDVVYEGVPSSMTINSPSDVTKYNLGKDSVDLLYVGKSYSLNLAMDNIFHSVGSKFNDFTVTVTGVGSVTCGTYTKSGRGAGWSSHSNIVDFSKIAKEFITTSTSGNTLTINVTKSLYDYYESSETKIVEGNGETTIYTNMLYSLNTDDNGNKPYFIVKVQHKTYGFSAEYKFFIGEEVSKIATSKTVLTF